MKTLGRSNQVHTQLRIDPGRLNQRIEAMACMGAGEAGVNRLALSDADKAGRDLAVAWMKELGLTVHIDGIGNLIGVRPGERDIAPLVIGSHLDTVHNAGRFDGSYGVLAGLELVQTLDDHAVRTQRPVAIVAFTNEEGVRFPTDMLGSRVFCGGLSLAEGRLVQGFDGTTVGQELDRIGYTGEYPSGGMKPFAYLELHVEQGPSLHAAGIPIGVVKTVTGISWQEITIRGRANHAGSTPMDVRRDAGLAAAGIITYLRELALAMGGSQRATCGMIAFQPNAVNVIPGQATLTVDLRNTDEAGLQEAERRLAAYLAASAEQWGVEIATRSLARVPAVHFQEGILGVLEAAAGELGLPHQRMDSGAGHDAQVLAGICPAGMIFVPSQDGVSHSPDEFTRPEDLEAGANLLLQAVLLLAGREGGF
ncbi:MAG: M20 family metallo-hydrolase [Chloroflexota bacterium]